MRRIELDDSLLDLHEAKTKLLTAFEDKYGKDFVYSPEMTFEFTTSTAKLLYKLLNAYLFNNALNAKKLRMYNCTLADIRAMCRKYSINMSSSEYYALYVPEISKKTKKLVNESMLFIDDYGPKTFLFAASCLCHEMIHQYDAHHGILTQILEEDEALGIDRSHETPIFVRFMRLAAVEGLRVMINGNNTPYDILNQEAIQFTMNLQEDADHNFEKLVARLEAGEQIPNVFLTDRDTVAFFIP